MINLNNLKVSDLNTAEKRGFENNVCSPGEHDAKFLKLVEEDTYSYMVFVIDGKEYYFFYNAQTENNKADYNWMNWFINLATIPTDDNTSLMAIYTSALQRTYRIKVRNYIPQKGKNAGVTQHAIDFTFLPKLVDTGVPEISEELADELPF